MCCMAGASFAEHRAELGATAEWGAGLPVSAGHTAHAECGGDAAQVPGVAARAVPCARRHAAPIPSLIRRVAMRRQALHTALPLLSCQRSRHARYPARSQVSHHFGVFGWQWCRCWVCDRKLFWALQVFVRLGCKMSLVSGSTTNNQCQVSIQHHLLTILSTLTGTMISSICLCDNLLIDFCHSFIILI